MILYPQLPHVIAEHLAIQRRSLSIAEAAALAAPDHTDAVFTPTGGSRAEPRDLEKLREKLLETSATLGYPNGADEGARAAFDKEVAVVLHASMQLHPSEASKSGIWEFLSCVLLCDLVRWRFPGGNEGTPVERLLAGRRNTFQRLWWRGFVFHDEKSEGRYDLLYHLGEDEIVQIMERPFLAGSRALSRTVGRELLAASERHERLSRRTLIREVQKRLRRLAAFTSFEAVDEQDLTPLVRSVFDEVAHSVAT